MRNKIIMTLTTKHVVSITIALVTVLCILFINQVQLVGASAPPGIPAFVATTSQMTVNTTASRVLATTTACSSRIISTVASPITISFSDRNGFVPSGLVGHVQAASTTVAYDSGLYGCDAMRIYSFSATDITVTQTY